MMSAFVPCHCRDLLYGADISDGCIARNAAHAQRKWAKPVYPT